MKRFFFALSLIVPFAASAQTSLPDNKQNDLLGQGRLHIGVNANVGYGGFVGLNARVMPRLQYFLKDGWSIAAEARLETNGRQYNYLGAGLSTRYYFIRDRRLAVFGQVGATYGQSRFWRLDPAAPFSLMRGIETTSPAWQANAGLGVHYRLSNRWSVEAVAERTLTNYRGWAVGVTQYGRWQGSIGVNYRLGR